MGCSMGGEKGDAGMKFGKWEGDRGRKEGQLEVYIEKIGFRRQKGRVEKKKKKGKRKRKSISPFNGTSYGSGHPAGPDARKWTSVVWAFPH